jgi:hypothetical protein
MYDPFLLPFSITFEQQQQLVESAKAGNHYITGQPVSYYNGEEFVDTPLTKRKTLLIESHRSHTPNGKSEYDNRLNLEVNWQWRDTPAAQLVKQLLEPLSDVIQPTRVITILVSPGSFLPCHVDSATDHTYKHVKNYLPEGDRTEHHSNQYAAIKIPVTERDGDNGLPYIEVRNKMCYYDVGKSYFVIDEMHHPHGADPVDFYRGVLFIDGIVDFDKLRTLKSKYPKYRRK